MKVFKFGGASVKDAKAVRNVAEIIRAQKKEPLIVIISAMGKTTNAFEKLLKAFFDQKDNAQALLEDIKKFHFQILDDLFASKDHPIYGTLSNTFVEVEWQLEDPPVGTFDYEYDQMVGIGELLSTQIVSAYLKEVDLKNQWLDARDVIRTDNTYREAKVDWKTTTELMQKRFQAIFAQGENPLIISQGFIGSSSENFTTTLGREGSDFSAAIFAACLCAESVTIWKDVEGMLNADPKYYKDTKKLDNISYNEAVELAYYGASVIHPKTIKPLHNKNIPLKVKSFVRPTEKGTLIDECSDHDTSIPSYIHKNRQILISISPRDYAFIAENNLSDIFQQFSQHGISINIMQNSAISFSVCVDDGKKINDLIEALKSRYKVTFNRNVRLLTIRHYNEKIINELISSSEILLEQKSRNTLRLVIN